VQITVLGCSGSVPGPGFATSGYLVEAEGFCIVLELGNGTFSNLQQRCHPFDVTAVLLSHLHTDHCGDFSALTAFRENHPDPPVDPRLNRLPVYAPDDARRRLAAAHAPNSPVMPFAELNEFFQFLSLTPRTSFEVGPFTIEAVPMNHICETFGFRISHAGRTLAYTGDTALCDGVQRLARDADLFLADASWREQGTRPDRLHMSGREAADVARTAGAGHLMLTHVLPWTDKAGVLADAAETFPGRVSLAEEGHTFTL
jgi:ribonuclease BN (tRNA processing enzyme)